MNSNGKQDDTEDVLDQQWEQLAKRGCPDWFLACQYVGTYLQSSYAHLLAGRSRSVPEVEMHQAATAAASQHNNCSTQQQGLTSHAASPGLTASEGTSKVLQGCPAFTNRETVMTQQQKQQQQQQQEAADVALHSNAQPAALQQTAAAAAPGQPMPAAASPQHFRGSAMVHQ
jgi:hypothetical protein